MGHPADSQTDAAGARFVRAGFGCPSGLVGRIGGWLMARGNATTERHVVEIAGLRADDVVLVVGPGPGIGLQEAGIRARHVIGIDPSKAMLDAAERRCATLIRQGKVAVVPGVADDTGQPDSSMDVVLTVNNVHLWPNWHAGFAELHRVLRHGGQLLLSAHEKWLPGGQSALTDAVEQAGFREVATWTWQPPTRGATAAAQLRARRQDD